MATPISPELHERHEVIKSLPIVRIFGQPNKNTFTIYPIKKLLERYVGSGLLLNGKWVDPFAGHHSPAGITNDLNPEIEASHHMDALQFLRQLPSECADGVLYDPPYSLNQAKEVYKKYGADLFDPTKMDYWARCKDEVARILKPNGLVICCGWTSMGLGKGRGFEMKEVLLVPHGGSKNDTIVTVEAKLEVSDLAASGLEPSTNAANPPREPQPKTEGN